MKTRFIRLVLVLLSLGLLFQAASAAENETKDYSNEPWERAAIYLGAFIVDTNSDLELGLGGGALGVKVDAEGDWRKILPYFVRMGSGESPAATGWILLSTN
jgi:hypothetical protein